MKIPVGFIIIPVFIALSVVLIANHEPWRDEAHLWVIGRDAPDPAFIIRESAYEGTPALWIMLMFILAKSGLPYISMFILNFLLMLAGLAAFLAYSPFSRLQKALFSFSYYIFYLYNIVARNYVLFVMFLLFIAVLYKHRHKKPFLYSFLVILLANTTVHGMVVAIVLAFMYLIETTPWRKASLKKYAFPLLIIILGITAAIIQLLPPDDLGYRGTWFFGADRFGIVTNSAFRAFLPVSQGLVSFSLSLLGIPILLLSMAFFIRKPRAMAIYLISVLGILAISFLRGYGGARHDGLIFMTFVFCLWISENYKDSPLVKNRRLLRILSRKNLMRLFTLVLAFQVASAAVASYMELTSDFSAGKRTAMFLVSSGYAGNDTFIASYPSYTATSLLPYMPGEHSKFYCVEFQEYCSIIVWNDTFYRNSNLSVSEVMGRMDRAVSGKDFTNVLLILNKNETGTGFLERYDLMASFSKSITPDEVYYIYSLKG